MKLGFVSAILGDLTLEEVLAFAADEGFDCVEIMCWPPGQADRRYAGVTHIDVTIFGVENAARVKDLDNSGVLSQEQIDQRRYQARAARATARAQAAVLKDLQTRAGKLAVSAPVSGLVLEKTVRPGDLSAGGATPWFRLARDGEIELSAELSEADLAHIRPGQGATVTLPGGGVAQGHVRLISPQIDPQTKLGEVRVLFKVRPTYVMTFGPPPTS